MPFDREKMQRAAAELAAKGVLIGTSSWKYEGWLGQLYTAARYEYRGKVATTRFERDCLAEYAEVFKTVCVDAAYYTFPNVKYLEGLAAQVPSDFQFAFKVTDAITLKRFPNLPRFGIRAGQVNPDYLNADLFATTFGSAVDYAQVVKTYTVVNLNKDAASRYSPAEVVKTEKRRIMGSPLKELDTTSHIEKQNHRRHSKAYLDVVEMQRSLFGGLTSAKIGPSDFLHLARAWCKLEDCKRRLKMKLKILGVNMSGISL